MAVQPGVGPWFRLYVNPGRGFTRELVRRAEAAGCRGLVITVDAPVSLRNREQRAGFRPSPGIEAANLPGQPTAPAPATGNERDAPRALLAGAAGWAAIDRRVLWAG